jgi:hypothetical protein
MAQMLADNKTLDFICVNLRHLWLNLFSRIRKATSVFKQPVPSVPKPFQYPATTTQRPFRRDYEERFVAFVNLVDAKESVTRQHISQVVSDGAGQNHVREFLGTAIPELRVQHNPPLLTGDCEYVNDVVVNGAILHFVHRRLSLPHKSVFLPGDAPQLFVSLQSRPSLVGLVRRNTQRSEGSVIRQLASHVHHGPECLPAK